MGSPRNMFIADKEHRVKMVLSNTLPNAVPVIEDNLTRSLDDGTNEVRVVTTLLHPRVKDIKEDEYIIYPVDEGYKEYRIIEIDDFRGETSNFSMVGELSAYGELIDSIVRPTEFYSASLQTIINYILQDTNWRLGDSDDFPMMDYIINDFRSVLEVLRELEEIYGAELDFDYTMDRNRITDRRVRYYKSYNDTVSKIILKERDLVSIKKTVDMRQLCTAMIGEGGIVGDRPITMANVNVTPPSGFIKEFGSDMIYNTESYNLYNRDGKHRIGVYKNTDVKSDMELYNRTLEALKEVMTPLITYSVEMAYAQQQLGLSSNIRMGNTVYVNDMTQEPYIAVTARVRVLETSETNPINNKATFGNYKTIKVVEKDNIKQLQNQLQDMEKEWNKAKWTMELISSNGIALKKDMRSTKLTIMVYKGGKEYDPLGTQLNYVWRRYNQEGEQIPISEGVWQLEQKDLVVFYQDEGDVAIYEGHVSGTAEN